MNSPKAIGFDLFNTLITIHPHAMEEAHQRLIHVLHQEKIQVESADFMHAYVDAAKHFLKETRKDGRETHNRFWIAAALESLEVRLSPEDPRVARAVDAYFSAFYPHCRLIPGTTEVLGELAERYPLGLLSNFTHPPAVDRILDLLELPRFFRTVLVSGSLGYRKPHPSVFQRLVVELGVPADEILFVGDDPVADVEGARQAGLQPVLTTCVQNASIPNAQTLLSPSQPDCPPDVPCISSWQNLLSFLNN